MLMKTLLIRKLKIEIKLEKKEIYKLADTIRKELENNGVIVEDNQDQTNWKYK